jgi:hypothetical protein
MLLTFIIHSIEEFFSALLAAFIVLVVIVMPCIATSCVCREFYANVVSCDIIACVIACTLRFMETTRAGILLGVGKFTKPENFIAEISHL